MAQETINRYGPSVSRKRFRPSVNKLVTELRELAFKNPPSAKLPNARELCLRYQTSSTTLNDALQELELQNVIERRQGSGIYVSPRLHCKNIRVLTGIERVQQSSVAPFWGILWAKLFEEAQRRASFKDEQIQFELIGSDLMKPLPRDVLQGLESDQIHGVLSVWLDYSNPSYTIDKDIPMVSFAGPGYWTVELSADRVIGEAVARLVAMGCEKIGWWTPYNPDDLTNPDDVSESLAVIRRRHEPGVMAAFQKSGVRYRPELNCIGVHDGNEFAAEMFSSPNVGAKQGYQAAMHAFRRARSTWPDGLVIVDDMMTTGVLTAFRELGIAAGKDVKIASHSNATSPQLFGWERELLIWEVDAGEIVTAMFALLDRLMAGERPDEPTITVEQRFPPAKTG
jgi:DNA-binding LacI/PurR family transcriptional regulator